MFDVAPTELLLVIVVALVVIGPKDLPKAMRFVGKWMGKARGMARHFRSGLDTMMREAELEELEKQWREQNDAIMREFPRIDDVNTPPSTAPALPEPGKRSEPDADQAAAATPPETHVVPPRDGPLP
ncbi:MULTISPECIES: Sec-independent protein translocase protein TatB [unclassified Sphingopyxis]|uniref:Sec-independent protein translocase protein TatB n=1 Tax=unclassified Sphingopyxis TaxID=2614943 RepID=UPI00285D94FB|nr:MULTISPECIES: Sec-independent protein translocase protein TatB [unclassified Sphingopyxis]MDR6831839.1 sec-independent protein translocase protein TatB [Sphingopyxis sp. BE122]MDR7227581.1 sec-independent protein translocase protein TatB [Sphingopyxis sp. BE259]